MNVQQLVSKLSSRGFKIRLENGSLRVDPFPKLTVADRAAIAEVAADTGARSTLERLLREGQISENSGDPAKSATAATATVKLSPADALLIREAQRKFPGSALVGLGRPGPRHAPDRAAPVPAEAEPINQPKRIVPPPEQAALVAGASAAAPPRPSLQNRKRNPRSKRRRWTPFHSRSCASARSADIRAATPSLFSANNAGRFLSRHQLPRPMDARLAPRRSSLRPLKRRRPR